MKIKGVTGSVHISGGCYFLVIQNKWHRLSKVSEGQRAMLAAIDNLRAQPVKSEFAVAIEDYLAHHLPKLTYAVRKEYERMFAEIARGFEPFQSVDEVRPRDVLDFLDDYPKQAAKQSYKYRLSGFFAWCVVAGLRDTNPCREITIKGPVRKKTPWTDDLFLAVRDKLSPMMRCYHDLTYLVWQRATDVRLLERRQIVGGVIRFNPTKTEHSSGAAVDITITPQIQATLDEALSLSRSYGVVSPYVIHERDGTRYTRSGVYSAYRRADIAIHGKATGLNPKSIRPYVVTRAEAQGYDMRAMQERLAHSSGTTTEGYIQTHSVPVSSIALPLPTRKS